MGLSRLDLVKKDDVWDLVRKRSETIRPIIVDRNLGFLPHIATVNFWVLVLTIFVTGLYFLNSELFKSISHWQDVVTFVGLGDSFWR